jgi:hypothetical protein
MARHARKEGVQRGLRRAVGLRGWRERRGWVVVEVVMVKW